MTTHSSYEAVELRHGDKGRYLGNSVSSAVKNINEKISEALIGMDPALQSQTDQAMIDLDKTGKKRLCFLFFPVFDQCTHMFALLQFFLRVVTAKQEKKIMRFILLDGKCTQSSQME
ncbi:hypothetical protein D5086_002243 [Populus alba]|uniref:Uncharacterized protein n=1 Tax=Populus alba TaxID=43335 RepID=A0ACC4D275_POPAL